MRKLESKTDTVACSLGTRLKWPVTPSRMPIYILSVSLLMRNNVSSGLLGSTNSLRWARPCDWWPRWPSAQTCREQCSTEDGTHGLQRGDRGLLFSLGHHGNKFENPNGSARLFQSSWAITKSSLPAPRLLKGSAGRVPGIASGTGFGPDRAYTAPQGGLRRANMRSRRVAARFTATCELRHCHLGSVRTGDI